MPIHTLTFDLPDEREELETVLNAGKMSAALNDFSSYLRSEWKYSERSKWPDLEKIRDKFHEICAERGVVP